MVEKKKLYIVKKKRTKLDFLYKIEILEETEKTIYYHNLDNDTKTREFKEVFDVEFEIIETL